MSWDSVQAAPQPQPPQPQPLGPAARMPGPRSRSTRGTSVPGAACRERTAACRQTPSTALPQGPLFQGPRCTAEGGAGRRASWLGEPGRRGGCAAACQARSTHRAARPQQGAGEPGQQPTWPPLETKTTRAPSPPLPPAAASAPPPAGAPPAACSAGSSASVSANAPRVFTAGGQAGGGPARGPLVGGHEAERGWCCPPAPPADGSSPALVAALPPRPACKVCFEAVGRRHPLVQHQASAAAGRGRHAR